MAIGPDFPSFWAATVTVACCVLAWVLGVVAPHRWARLRRGLWIYGGALGLVITLALLALEGIPMSALEP